MVLVYVIFSPDNFMEVAAILGSVAMVCGHIINILLVVLSTETH
jgi:hypothetical protein